MQTKGEYGKAGLWVTLAVVTTQKLLLDGVGTARDITTCQLTEFPGGPVRAHYAAWLGAHEPSCGSICRNPKSAFDPHR